MKATISNRLKQIMNERNLKQVDILNKTIPLQSRYNVRLAKNDLSQYVNGKVEPNQDRIFILAKALDVSEAWLLGYDVPKNRIDKDELDITTIFNQLEEYRQARVYNFAEKQLEEQQRDNVVNLNDYIEVTMSGYLSAGTGEYLSEDVQEQVRIPKSIVPSDDYDLVLQVNGDSMQPMFEDHEYIFVKKTTEIRSGQIGVFIIDGESYLKKAYIEDNHLRLVSLNSKYEDLIFDDINDITVVGTVVM